MVRAAGGLLVGLAVAGCGGGSEPARSHSLDDVRSCLEAAGVDARGGAYDRPADDTDAPDGELVTTRATFIAFYESVERADALEAELRKRAGDLGGTLTRHGKITVFYGKAAGVSDGKPDARIEDCVG
jgi:hypothetical protein